PGRSGPRTPPAPAGPAPAAAEVAEAPPAEPVPAPGPSIDIQVSAGRIPADYAVAAADSRIPADQAWRTAADEGWQAARQAAQPEVAAVTDAGLPKRVPMAQLVPGGVEKAPTNANRRSPEQVRGL